MQTWLNQERQKKFLLLKAQPRKNAQKIRIKVRLVLTVMISLPSYDIGEADDPRIVCYNELGPPCLVVIHPNLPFFTAMTNEYQRTQLSWYCTQPFGIWFQIDMKHKLQLNRIVNKYTVSSTTIVDNCHDQPPVLRQCKAGDPRIVRHNELGPPRPVAPPSPAPSRCHDKWTPANLIIVT